MVLTRNQREEAAKAAQSRGNAARAAEPAERSDSEVEVLLESTARAGGDGERLGRGCRVRRPTEFYSVAAMTQQPSQKAKKKLRGRAQRSPRAKDYVNARASKTGRKRTSRGKNTKTGDSSTATDKDGSSGEESSDEAKAVSTSEGSSSEESSEDSRGARRKRPQRDNSLLINQRPKRLAASQAVRRIRALENAGDLPDEAPAPRGRRAVASRSEAPASAAIPSQAVRVPQDALTSSSSSSDNEGSGSDESPESVVSDPREKVRAAMKRRASINGVLRNKMAGFSRGRGGAGGAAADDEAIVAASVAAGRKRPRDDDTGRGGGDGEGGTDAAALGDITPLAIDPSVTFDSVGGLPEHILVLREMVILPLLYPALMSRLNITPPRGVLFVGPPGTGKTLLARALANEGRIAGRNVTFFMRKGADILSKWVGESEKQLRLLFDEARRREPSVIFFDEIDGLAPVRHSKQEQSHAALVSTLLALMDGMDSRGQVVVLGATNRPDTIDPALRRPGRFDRELRFPVPNAPARHHILSIHMGMRSGANNSNNAAAAAAAAAATPIGTGPHDGSCLHWLVANTEGFSGADLRAVCTEASLAALRRSVPQIYVSRDRLDVAGVRVALRPDDYKTALRRIAPAMSRVAAASSSAFGSGGGGDGVAPLDAHSDRLVAASRDSAVALVEALWGPAAQRARDARRACTDLAAAAIEMSRVPPPPTRGALFFVLSTTRSHEARGGSIPGAAPIGDGAATSDDFAAQLCLAAVVRALPSVVVHSVHLPNACSGGGGGDEGTSAGAGGWDGGSDEDGGGANTDNAGGDDGNSGGAAPAFSATLAAAVSAAIATAPSVLVLQGLEAWAEALGLAGPSSVDNGNDNEYGGSAAMPNIDDAVRATHAAATARRFSRCAALLRYNLTRLALHDVLVVVATVGTNAARARARALFPPHAADGGQVAEFVVPASPAPMDVAAFFRLLADNVLASRTSSLPPPSAWRVLPVDDTPLPARKPRRPARLSLAVRREQWHRVAYKRAQLRSVLRAWLNALVGNRSNSVFLDADLDLAAAAEGSAGGDEAKALLRGWRAHTRGRRVSLGDMLDRLDRGAYTCLSQYNADIEQLCSNVKGFFSARDQRAMRYRSRAAAVKETTMIHNHRIRRALVAFCEDTKDVTEPRGTDESSTASSEESDASEDARRAAEEAEGSDSGAFLRDDNAGASVEEKPKPAPRPPKKPVRYFGQRRRKQRRKPPVVARKEPAAEGASSGSNTSAGNSDGDDDGGKGTTVATQPPAPSPGTTGPEVAATASELQHAPSRQRSNAPSEPPQRHPSAGRGAAEAAATAACDRSPGVQPPPPPPLAAAGVTFRGVDRSTSLVGGAAATAAVGRALSLLGATSLAEAADRCAVFCADAARRTAATHRQLHAAYAAAMRAVTTPTMNDAAMLALAPSLGAAGSCERRASVAVFAAASASGVTPLPTMPSDTRAAAGGGSPPPRAMPPPGRAPENGAKVGGASLPPTACVPVTAASHREVLALLEETASIVVRVLGA